MAKLLDPSKDKKEAFLRMAQDWLDHGNDRYGLALEDFDAYLARVHRFRDAAQIPVGRVPETEFWLGDDAGEIVACVRLRFWLTPLLEVEGGHIGYDVRPSSRGRGFGTAALGLVLPEARRRGLERVRLTVNSDNLTFHQDHRAKWRRPFRRSHLREDGQTDQAVLDRHVAVTAAQQSLAAGAARCDRDAQRLKRRRSADRMTMTTIRPERPEDSSLIRYVNELRGSLGENVVLVSADTIKSGRRLAELRRRYPSGSVVVAFSAPVYPKAGGAMQRIRPATACAEYFMRSRRAISAAAFAVGILSVALGQALTLRKL